MTECSCWATLHEVVRRSHGATVSSGTLSNGSSDGKTDVATLVHGVSGGSAVGGRERNSAHATAPSSTNTANHGGRAFLRAPLGKALPGTQIRIEWQEWQEWSTQPAPDGDDREEHGAIAGTCTASTARAAIGEVVITRPEHPCWLLERTSCTTRTPSKQSGRGKHSEDTGANGWKWMPVHEHFSGDMVAAADATNSAAAAAADTAVPMLPCDLSSVEGGVYWVGRKDRQFKRSGHRLHPDEIAATIEQNASNVQQCKVLLVSPPADELCSTNGSGVVTHQHRLVAACAVAPELLRGTANGEAKVRANLQQIIKTVLPPAAIPDQLLIMETIPRTTNGKADTTMLLRMAAAAATHAKTARAAAALLEPTTPLQHSKQAIWTEVLTASARHGRRLLLPETLAAVSATTSYLEAGGDSHAAVLLAAHLITAIVHTATGGSGGGHANLQAEMLTALLGEAPAWTVVDVISKGLEPDALQLAAPLSPPSPSPSLQASAAGNRSAKRIRLAGETTVDTNGDVLACVQVASRARPFHRNVVAEMLPQIPQGSSTSTATKLVLQSAWKVELGKCNDATPLLVARHSGSSTSDRIGSAPPPTDTVAYVGSHSYKFAAIAVESGHLLWTTTFKDRVDSSACISACGTLLAVGCHDRHLYIIQAATGKVVWRYETGDQIKSSPVANPSNHRHVYVGSHDGYVHAVDIVARQPLWKVAAPAPAPACGRDAETQPPAAAVFSSPVLDAQQRLLYTADLAGMLCCWRLNGSSTVGCAGGGSRSAMGTAASADSGALVEAPPALVWQTSMGGPIFSTPTLDDASIFVGCTNKKLACLNRTTGDVRWTVETGGPIFSSPLLVPARGKSTSVGAGGGRAGVVVVGSHDGHVYCADATSGAVIWKQCLGSSTVYASPTAAPLLQLRLPLAVGEGDPDVALAIVACNTAGELHVFAHHDGALLAKLVLPGQVFSSPVCCSTRGVVGSAGGGSGGAGVGGGGADVSNGMKVIIGCRDDYIHCLEWRYC